MERTNIQFKRRRLVSQTNKNNHPRKVIPREDDDTQVVGVEAEVENLPSDVLSVTS